MARNYQRHPVASHHATHCPGCTRATGQSGRALHRYVSHHAANGPALGWCNTSLKVRQTTQFNLHIGEINRLHHEQMPLNDLPILSSPATDLNKSEFDLVINLDTAPADFSSGSLLSSMTEGKCLKHFSKTIQCHKTQFVNSKTILFPRSCSLFCQETNPVTITRLAVQSPFRLTAKNRLGLTK